MPQSSPNGPRVPLRRLGPAAGKNCSGAGALGGSRLPFPFDMRALHALVAEFPLKLTGHDFMAAVVVTVRNRLHRLKVNARPGHMNVRPAFFHMGHHDARLPGKAELLFKPVDRFADAVAPCPLTQRTAPADRRGAATWQCVSGGRR